MAVALLALLAGCAPSVRPAVSLTVADDIFAPPGPGFYRDDPGLYDRELRQVSLAGAINETLGFYLAVSAGDHEVPDFDVSATNLRSADSVIDAPAVQVYRLHDVQIERWPGWHIRWIEPGRRTALVPDVAVPANAPEGGLPVTLQPHKSLPLWVDVHVPKATSPGAYTGRLTLCSGSRTIETLDIRLTVWPFLLPDEPGVNLLVELDHRSLIAQHLGSNDRPYRPERIFEADPRRAEAEALIHDTFRLLQGHRVFPVLHRLYPVARITVSQDVEVDWSDYDRVVGALLDGTAFVDRWPLPAWPVPMDERFPPPPPHGAMESPTYSRTLRQYLTACATHYRDRGWLDRAYLVLPYAHQPEPSAFEAALHFGRIAHDADPALRRRCDLFPQDMSLWGWSHFPHVEISSVVDLWCPPAQFFDPVAWDADGLTSASRWYRLDRPPFSGSVRIEASPVTTWVIPWQAYRLGVPTVAVGPAADDDADATNLTPQACIERCPDLLIYPGRPFGLTEPVPSMRLKRLRRGMQDLAYVRLLDARGLSHVSAAVAESLVPRVGAATYDAHYADGRTNAWIDDPYWWRVARAVMADELLHRLEAPDDDPTRLLGSSLQWRRFMEATRALRIRVSGVRVRATGPSPREPLSIETTLTLENGTRLPVAGIIGFGELPIGWSAQPTTVRVPEIAPGSARRAVLTAAVAAIDWNEAGVRYLPIVFEPSSGPTLRISARLSYLPAEWLDSPPRIDGDLSDWPSGHGNVASDFVLITGEPPDAPGLPAARPAATTRCLVGRDRDALYFGFRCTDDHAPELGRASNLIQYEDLIPVGEELVEILIDPESTSTRSTGDLYHLVIKPGGALWERGIGTDPPTGPHRVWAADIQHAVRWHTDRWEAEVRIPFAAFDRPLRQREVWSVNFTRFDAGRDEYANWAAAVTNAYDPMSLGNLGL